MNCCFIIILLLLCGKCGNGNNSSCGNSCIQPRRRSSNVGRSECNDNSSDSGLNCTRTQTVITRTECDTDSCSCNMNMATDNYGSNRYSMYNMKDDDCGCRN